MIPGLNECLNFTCDPFCETEYQLINLESDMLSNISKQGKL
jgi:hypothetical protein